MRQGQILTHILVIGYSNSKYIIMDNTALSKINTFGDMLKLLRRRARLTQAQLGAMVGYSNTLIARFESNTRRPDIDLVCPKLIEALGVADQPVIKQKFIELAQCNYLILPVQQDLYRHPMATRSEHFTHLQNKLYHPQRPKKSLQRKICDLV